MYVRSAGLPRHDSVAGGHAGPLPLCAFVTPAFKSGVFVEDGWSVLTTSRSGD